MNQCRSDAYFEGGYWLMLGGKYQSEADGNDFILGNPCTLIVLIVPSAPNMHSICRFTTFEVHSKVNLGRH
jgi:hypothetical protein